MRFNAALHAILLAVAAGVPAAYAHPGHVHGPGPVHGYAWTDFALFLLAGAAVPALALLLARRRRP